MQIHNSEEESASEQPQPSLVYPIVNFFRGRVSEDRIKHESDSQNGGLAHWRHNTSKQRDHDEQILHDGVNARTRYDRNVQRTLPGYDTPTTGMGLEGENLYSFIRSNRQNVIPLTDNENLPAARSEWESSGPAEVAESEDSTSWSAQSEVTTAPAQPHTELPSGAPAPAILFKFRRMKTATFTNLLARALNQ